MIHHLQGNLLTSDCTIIIHQSNCLMGFGSGIAGQIRQQYPRAYQAFAKDDRKPEEKLGSFSTGIDNGKIFYNMYGQYDFGGLKGIRYTDYDAFRSGLDSVLTDITHMKDSCIVTTIDKIGMPYLIGCGLAGGDWEVVYKIIEEVAAEHEMDIYLYEYTP